MFIGVIKILQNRTILYSLIFSEQKMPKLDPSNYTLSEEEKVFNLCQNTKDLILDRCQCNVSIDQKEKTVKISVDPSLAQLYEEGLTTLERLYPQEMDFDEDEG